MFNAGLYAARGSDGHLVLTDPGILPRARNEPEGRSLEKIGWAEENDLDSCLVKGDVLRRAGMSRWQSGIDAWIFIIFSIFSPAVLTVS